MNVWTKENKMDLSKEVIIEFANVTYMIKYDKDGKKLEDKIIRAHCPYCKHFVSCSGSKVWYAKQRGGCDDFETE